MLLEVVGVRPTIYLELEAVQDEVLELLVVDQLDSLRELPRRDLR